MSIEVTVEISPVQVEVAVGGVNPATLIPKSTLSAKGSLITATAAATPADLPVGANGTVLTPDSTTAKGLAYKTLAALGALVTSAFAAANQIAYSTAAGVVSYLTVGTNTLVGNIGAGVAALTPAQVKTLLTYLASEIGMSKLGTPTYTTVQHAQDVFHSSGWISGGTISDDSGGTGATFAVAAGCGLIRATASPVAELLWFDWPASAGIAISNGQTLLVGVEYNGGTPQITTKTSPTWDYLTDFPLGVVSRDGTTLHLASTPQRVGDHAGLMIRRLFEAAPLARDERSGGLVLGETGTRNPTISAGALWDGLNRYALDAFDANAGGTFETYRGSTEISVAQTQYDNTQYDTGLALAALTNNRYGVRWFYEETDGGVSMVYGTSNAVTVSEAQEEAPPSTVPARFSYHAKLIGRIIVRKNAASAALIESAFTTAFRTAQVTQLSDLASFTLAELNTQVSDATLSEVSATNVAAAGAVMDSDYQTVDALTYIDPSALTADQSLPIVPRYKAGTGTLVKGRIYNLGAASAWSAVDADTASGAGVKGLLGVALGTSPTTHGLMLRGFVYLSAGLTGSPSAGDLLYVSGTAGTLTATAPVAGQFGRVVGYMVTATIAYFDPSADWWEVG